MQHWTECPILLTHRCMWKKCILCVLQCFNSSKCESEWSKRALFTNSGYMTLILQLMWSTVMIHSPVWWCDIIFSCWSSPAWIISASLCLFCYCHEDRVGQDLVPWMVALVLCWKVGLYCSDGVCESTAASAAHAHSCAKLCTENLVKIWINRK